MKLSKGIKAPNFLYDTPYEKGVDFYSSLKADHSILIFSRYIGCSLCQLKLMDMVRIYGEIKKRGGEVFFVLQSAGENAKARLEEMGVRFPVILDPEETLYKLYQVTPAKSKFGLISLKVLGLIRKAKKEHIVHGKYEGNELQLPAAFVVSKEGVIEFAHYGKHAADYPGNNTLLDMLD